MLNSNALKTQGVEILQSTDITYLTKDLLTPDGLKIMPSSYYKDVSSNDLQLFCLINAIYNLPTLELIWFLQEEIGQAKAIEIGSGNGVMAKALNITATDTLQQADLKYKRLYEAMQQPTIKYGVNVERYEAEEAVYHYKPDIVIGAWVTHKYNPKRHFEEGNEVGIREEKIIEKCKKYIFIGHEFTHRKKPILRTYHRIVKADWLISRIHKKHELFDEMICIWE